jgi:hypothetical protein
MKQTETKDVAKRIGMGFEIVDRYLLGEPVSKPDVVAAILANRSPDPAAQPFYRAFEAVGTRAADEAFIALRLVLSGKPTSDEAVRRLRALASVARSARAGDLTSLKATLTRDHSVLPDLPTANPPPTPANLQAIITAAESAYHTELA